MIGIIILTFQSSNVIEACLESLYLSDYSNLRVAVCDNESQDTTVAIIRKWAKVKHINLIELRRAEPNVPEKSGFLTLLHTGGNLGYAGGINAGIAYLKSDPRIDLFWILNPDCEATPGAAGAYAHCAKNAGAFALMGGRIRYHEPPNFIQSDGGKVSRWSGICKNINAGLLPDKAAFPDPSTLNFISGANMVASRRFIEYAGPMVEDYFLYYEEVDWAARRGDLPLLICPEAEVAHHGGTTIGTGSVSKRASPFANYFNFRNRMRFMRRFYPLALPLSWALSMLRVGKLLVIGAFCEAWAAFAGLNGLPPPTEVRNRIASDDRARAFCSRDRTR